MSSSTSSSNFLYSSHPDHRDLHSFPTRRSSDLNLPKGDVLIEGDEIVQIAPNIQADAQVIDVTGEDRKSTRLNSSHANSSYAVFCLKKKSRREGRAAGPRH